MNKSPLHAFVLVAMALLILAPGLATAQSGNINPSQRFAWMEEGGWLDFSPTGGGVTVGPTFLSGYAWGESIGWVKVGDQVLIGYHRRVDLNSRAELHPHRATGRTTICVKPKTK